MARDARVSFLKLERYDWLAANAIPPDPPVERPVSDLSEPTARRFKTSRDIITAVCEPPVSINPRGLAHNMYAQSID